MAFPDVDPREVRPSRVWFWVGGGVIVLGAVVALTLFIAGMVRSLALPDFTAEFADGQTAAVTLDDLDAGAWLIYVDEEVASGRVDCEVAGPDPAAGAGSAGFSHSVATGSEYWQLAKEIRVSEPGSYEITCTGVEGASYGVGRGEDFFGLLGRVATALAAVPVAFVATAAGAVILVVTAVRRGRHRRALAGRHPHTGRSPGW